MALPGINVPKVPKPNVGSVGPDTSSASGAIGKVIGDAAASEVTSKITGKVTEAVGGLVGNGIGGKIATVVAGKYANEVTGRIGNEIANNVGNAVGTIAKEVGVDAAIDAVANKAGEIADAVNNKVDEVIGDAVEKATEVGNDVINKASEIGHKALEGMVDTFHTIGDAAIGAATGVAESIGGLFNGGSGSSSTGTSSNPISGAGSNLINNLNPGTNIGSSNGPDLTGAIGAASGVTPGVSGSFPGNPVTGGSGTAPGGNSAVTGAIGAATGAAGSATKPSTASTSTGSGSGTNNAKPVTAPHSEKIAAALKKAGTELKIEYEYADGIVKLKECKEDPAIKEKLQKTADDCGTPTPTPPVPAPDPTKPEDPKKECEIGMKSGSPPKRDGVTINSVFGGRSLAKDAFIPSSGTAKKSYTWNAPNGQKVKVVKDKAYNWGVSKEFELAKEWGLVDNIAYTLEQVQKLEQATGASFTITSLYRSAYKNATIGSGGGSSTSSHMSGYAVDLKTKNNKKVAKQIVDLINEKKLCVNQFIFETHDFDLSQSSILHIDFKPSSSPRMSVSPKVGGNVSGSKPVKISSDIDKIVK